MHTNTRSEDIARCVAKANNQYASRRRPAVLIERSRRGDRVPPSYSPHGFIFRSQNKRPLLDAL